MNAIHIYVSDSEGNLTLVAELPKATPIPRVGELLVIPVSSGSDPQPIAIRELLVKQIVYDLLKQVIEILCTQLSFREPPSLTNSNVNLNFLNTNPDDLINAENIEALRKKLDEL